MFDAPLGACSLNPSSTLIRPHSPLKMSGACFFDAPIQLNQTINTPIPNRPATFLFLAPIAKCLDEIFPNRRYSFEAPIPTTDRTRAVLIRIVLFAFVVNYHFFSWLVYISSLLLKFSHKITAPTENYPVPNSTLFLVPRGDTAL